MHPDLPVQYKYLRILFWHLFPAGLEGCGQMGSRLWVWIFWFTLRFEWQRCSVHYEKKRLDEEWDRAAGGEKGNGMGRRRKIELCVKSLCQSLPGSSQCYHSPAALGQGADNPPREFRGGNTTAGLGGGTGSSTRGFVPNMTLHLQRHPWREAGVCPDCRNWEGWEKKMGRSVQRGVLWLLMFKKINMSLLPGP